MSHKVNLVRVFTAATGNSTPITLGAAYSQLFMTPAEAGAMDGRVYTYLIIDGNDWELGRGAYTASGTSLARTTIIASRISGTLGTSRIALTGTAQVRFIESAEDMDGVRGTRAVTSTSDVLANSDQGYVVTYSNAAAIAVSLAQASASNLFLAGWATMVQNLGAGTVTITPATSTINGTSTLTLATGMGAFIWSDGTNYRAYFIPARSPLLAANNLSDVTASTARTNLGAANIAGDTFTGPLKLKSGNGAFPVIPLEFGWGNETGSRWRVGLSTSHTLQWGRYDASNTWISTPLEMAIDHTTLSHGTAASNANMFRWGWANASYPHWQWWLLTGGGLSLAFHSSSTGLWQVNAFDVTSTSVTFNVPISKPSGTFLIDHPLDPANKDLAHAFIEGPRNDLIYRGEAVLVAGRATVDIDMASHMTAGTFAALTTNARVTSLQNQDGFARLRPGAIAGGSFEIICEDAASTDAVTWVVMAERNDPYVREIDPNCSRDEATNGRFIVERDKPDYPEEPA